VLNQVTLKGKSGRGSHADVVERYAGRSRAAAALIIDVAKVVGLGDQRPH